MINIRYKNEFSRAPRHHCWLANAAHPWLLGSGVISYPVLRLSALWLGVAGLAVLRGGGGVTGEGAELREGWAELRLEVRGQTGDMVVAVVLLRLVTACDS